MPQSEEDFKAFIRAITGGLHAIFDLTESFQETSPHPMSEDLPGLQSSLRAIAEDLMLCRNVREAISRRKEDQATLSAVARMINRLPPDNMLAAYRLAYTAVKEDWQSFPGVPIANFLIVLTGFELVEFWH